MAANQNTSNVVLPELKPANLRKLMRVSRAANISLRAIMDRAVEQWLAVEAPVYIEYAERSRQTV